MLSGPRKRSRIDSLDTKGKARAKPRAQAVQDMTDWQEELETVCERDNFVLDNEMFMDCKFLIGEGEKVDEVQCHRVYLAKSSPVFAAMLYGDLRKKNEVINLPDVNLEAFNAMLKYIYSGSIDLSKYSYEVICGFMYVAKKYLLPKSLQRHIRAYLWQHIYPDNVWTAILFSSNNDEPELHNIAWQVVERETTKSMQLESFVKLPMSVLLSLVERDNLSCTELQLFNACMRWADSEAGRLDLIPEPTALREILSPIIPHIRFLTMKGDDFANNVPRTNILSVDEMFPISLNLHIPKCKEVLNPICNTYVSRTEPKHESFFVFGYPEQESKYCKLEIGDKMCIENTNSEFVYATAPFNEGEQFIGIEVPSQIKSDTNKSDTSKIDISNTYEEDLTVIVFNTFSKEIVGKFKFKSNNVKYNTIIEIPFKDAISITESATSLHVTIIFHKTGEYPASRESGANAETVINYQGKFAEYPMAEKYYSKIFKYVHYIVWK